MRYLVQVVGELWSGEVCGYEYKAVGVPEGLAVVKTLTGDFRVVDDYQIIMVTNKTARDGAKVSLTHTAEVLKAWDKADSEAMFYDCVDA